MEKELDQCISWAMEEIVLRMILMDQRRQQGTFRTMILLTIAMPKPSPSILKIKLAKSSRSDSFRVSVPRSS
jgi:hypothetical protein